jgi:hypothetical protein
MKRFTKEFDVQLDAWRYKVDRDVLPAATAMEFEANDAQVIATKAMVAVETAPNVDGVHESLVS